jgi:hypothetical protein
MKIKTCKMKKENDSNGNEKKNIRKNIENKMH